MTEHQKHESFEYRLLLTPVYDETIKKEGIRFLLETTKQFTNFAYVIDVHDVLKGSSLQWTLHGLRAPSMIMPTTGTARFEKVYFDLPKKINFTFVKKGKLQHTAAVKFLKNGFEVTADRSGLLKIYRSEQEFNDNRISDSLAPELKPDVHRGSSLTAPEQKKKK